MKPDVADVYSRSERHAEGLNRAIEVLVKERILIVPDSSRRISYLVTHEPNPVVTRVRLDLIHCRASPGLDGRLHSHGGADRRKSEIMLVPLDAKLTVGDVVIHVALSGMRLAPGVFVRGTYWRFGKVGCARILRWFKSLDLHQDPMRYAVVSCGRCGCSQFDGKRPVNGLTQAREPMLSGPAFKLAPYGSEQPEQRWCLSGNHWCYNQSRRRYASNARNACFIQDWPICSKRSLLFAPPLMR